MRMYDEGYAIGPKMRAEFKRKSHRAAQGRLDATGQLAKAVGIVFDSVGNVTRKMLTHRKIPVLVDR